MTDELKYIYKLISTVYPMDELDKQALEQAKESLSKLIMTSAINPVDNSVDKSIKTLM